MRSKLEGIKCPHCPRFIPDVLVHSYDLSGCPLKQPCRAPGYLAAESAWPHEADDDDDDIASPPREPSLSGGAA